VNAPLVGARIQRKEDYRFLTGAGQYTDAIGAPAAVINAITDALGVKDVPMPATAQTVWRSLQTKAA
jgi:aerobic carbon-monoxide dehydrogenase large subunit